MTESIYEYFERRDRKAEAQKIVNQTQVDLLEETPAGFDAIFKAQFYPDPDMALIKVEGHRPTVATIVSDDAEIPVSRERMTLTEDMIKDMRLVKSYAWTGKELKMFQKMQQSDISAELKLIYEQHFFGTIRSLPVAIQDKSKMLAVPVGLKGALTFSDPISGIPYEIDYTGYTVAEHMPAALAGNARWNQPTTCTPLQNLRDHSDAIFQTSSRPLRKRPKYILMNYAVFLLMRECNEVKLEWLTMKGIGISDTPVLTGVKVPDDDLKAMISKLVNPDTGCEVVIMNSEISEEQANRTIVDKPLFQADGSTNWYMFGWDGMIERAFFPSTEAFLSGSSAGIFILNGQRVDKHPFRYWVEASANYMPLVPDPRMLAARKVV
jgi:hypothetical protein